jgi:hypothetical protein
LLSDARENNETLKLEDMEDLLDYGDFKDLFGKDARGVRKVIWFRR